MHPLSFPMIIKLILYVTVDILLNWNVHYLYFLDFFVRLM